MGALGALFCTNSKSGPVPRSGYFERASKVSAEVEKEFLGGFGVAKGRGIMKTHVKL